MTSSSPPLQNLRAVGRSKKRIETLEYFVACMGAKSG